MSGIAALVMTFTCFKLLQSQGMVPHLKVPHFTAHFLISCSCLDCKQTWNPFACTLHQSKLLELNYSHMHGPIATPPANGFCYSLADADTVLLSSVLLTGTSYSTVTTSLLTQNNLPVQQVGDALQNEEALYPGTPAATSAAAALHSLSPAPSNASSTCSFCGKTGHSLEHCFKFQDASKAAKESVAAQGKSRRRKGRANATQETQDAQAATESAGAASIHPSASLAALPDAWNADTGATSHMTPHREWFKSYTPSLVFALPMAR